MTQAAEIKRLFNEGKSISEIASLTGSDPRHIRRILRRHGLTAQVSFTSENRRFGVEIEFIFPEGNTHSIYSFAQALAQITSLVVAGESYNHETRSHWKLTTDASVCGGAELVSPILHGEQGFADLKKICDGLASLGARIKKSCGIHVHHEATDLSVDAFRQVVQNYNNSHQVISSTLAPSRRNNHYCQALSTWHMEGINASSTIRGMAQAQGGRYYAVNLQSFAKYGTIEFRQHQGSIEFSKIANWIKVGQAIIKAAQTNIALNNANFLTTLPATQEVVAHLANRQAYFARRAA